MSKPLSTVMPNTWEFLHDAMIARSGFREYGDRCGGGDGVTGDPDDVAGKVFIRDLFGETR